MLILVETNLLTKKKDSKRDIVWSSSASSIKIVFTLLTKVIALYILVFIIEI